MQSVEITVLSAENLRVGKKPVNKNAFVTVRADSSPDQCCCTTKMSVEGGCNRLTWNEKLAMDLDPATLQKNGFMVLEVHCKTSSSSSSTRNKLVGGVRVPVSDFLGGFMPRNHLQFLSYRLWDPSLERNGIINISVRVKSPEPYRCSQLALQPNEAVGLPVGDRRRRFGGVVTGVPAVWFDHRRHCTY